nr:NUDIX hydrolase [Nocardioides marinisabuli]
MRHSARALLLDEDDRLLLARHDLTTRHIGSVIWAPPGGGLEVGETPLEAVVRELAEEVALSVPMDGPRHVWHQQVVSSAYARGWDGAVFDYFLVKCDALSLPSTSNDRLLRDEGITEFRWWTIDQLHDASGSGLLRPHHLAALLSDLLTESAESYPIAI